MAPSPSAPSPSAPLSWALTPWVAAPVGGGGAVRAWLRGLLEGGEPLRALPPLPPRQHSCVQEVDGEVPTLAYLWSESPALSWGEPPKGTRALAVFALDLNPSAAQRAAAGGGPFALWGMTALPPAALAARRLEAGAGGRGLTRGGRPRAALGGGAHALSDLGRWLRSPGLRGDYLGYHGPCVTARGEERRVVALALALSRPLDLPSEGSPPLSARALYDLAVEVTLAAATRAWRARLECDTQYCAPPR